MAVETYRQVLQRGRHGCRSVLEKCSFLSRARSAVWILIWIWITAFLYIKPAQADENVIRLGYAKCAHCLSLKLVPRYAGNGIRIELLPFNTGSDVFIALLSHVIDIGQLTYMSLPMGLDRGIDLVAVAGQVSGGSQIVIRPDLGLKAGDWEGLKAWAARYKAGGKMLRFAASRGSPQDLQIRSILKEHDIRVGEDVQFVNIPNPADHPAALARGDIDLICTVEPFASKIRHLRSGIYFASPYETASGNLTNLMITRADVLQSNPAGIQSVVDAVVAVNAAIDRDHGLWIDTVMSATGLDRDIVTDAVGNLVPDYRMHRSQAQAIARMMFALKYISRDRSEDVAAHMDYRFLEKATSKTIPELGG
ncbi:ABC transporter substrate-binding protein [Gluconacetobacter sp. Hr-1-5]|uniref:ABC transporter substrate-binding protein n=1 Tax=Gluconacetobacter sp. Hr-1-5 TaxID=3395370 RepID=UPI003B521195